LRLNRLGSSRDLREILTRGEIFAFPFQISAKVGTDSGRHDNRRYVEIHLSRF
jgi:hypothetical protein